MHRIVLTLFVLSVFPLAAGAQENPLTTDSVTYGLYLAKKWPELLRESNKAIRQGTDFYYLRLRAGVAAYETAKFREAVKHFQKVFEENRKDGFLNSYYYWALVMAGRNDEANRLADGFSPDFSRQEKIRKKGLVSSLSPEFLLSGNSNFNKLLSEDIDSEGSFSNYRSVLRRQMYQGFSVDLHLFPRLNLYQNLNHIGIDRTQQYRSALNLLDTVKETTTAQYQYFISGRYQLDKGWNISVSATSVWGTSDYHIPEYVSGPTYRLQGKSWEIRDYLVSASIAKECLFFKPEAGFGAGEINRSSQFQVNLQVTVYPLKNANLYLTPRIFLHWDGNGEDPALIFSQKAGIKTGPVWLSAEYSGGFSSNFFSDNGLIVFNMPEKITGRWSTALWTPLFRYRFELMFRYQQTAKEGTTFVYSDATNFNTTIYGFTEKSLLISLKYNL